jgi:hypothetical protein
VNLKLSEPLIEAAKTKLQANMPGRVATINADSSLPDIQPPLKAPEASTYYTAPLSPMPPAMPAIVVMDGALAIEPLSEGPHSFITNTQLGVFIVEEHQDRQVLGKRLQRLSRAVIESLYDGDPKEQLSLADGTSAFRLMPLRTEPGPVFDADRPDTYRSFYLVIFMVAQVEE